MTEEKDKTKTSNLLKRKQHVNIECSFIQLLFIVLLRLFATVDSTHSQLINNTGTISDNEIQMLDSSVNHSKTDDQRIGMIENVSMIENTSLGINNITSRCEEEQEDLAEFTFWLEGVVEIVVSIVGLVANSVAVPLLTSSKRLSSSFNRLLACLAVMDNIFILTALLEAFRRYVFPVTNVHQLMFTYVFYPLQSMSLMCSNNATVVLALERYLAVTRPVEYHINVTASGSSPWRRVLRYMIPTVLFSVLFNLSKFFEVTCVYPIILANHTSGNNFTTTPVNITSEICQPQLTPLRANPIYALWYVHVARLFISGIIPFSLLVFLNVEVYRAVNSRTMGGAAASNRRTAASRNGQNSDQNSNNPSSARRRTTQGHHASSENNAEEQKMAIVLFFIVALYLVSNTPRLILNFYEFFINEAFQEASNPSTSNCFPLPHWVLVTTSISLVLITSNASTNFFIYCFVNTAFREELHRYGKVWIARLRLDKAYHYAMRMRWRKPEVVVIETENTSNANRIEMNCRSDNTIATEICVERNEKLIRGQTHNENVIPDKAVDPEVSNNEKISKNDHEKNHGSIHIEETHPLNVAVICVNGEPDEASKENKSSLLTIQPETVVKIYCDYDAVRV